MNKLRFLLSRALRMDVSGMLQTAQDLREKAKKPVPLILLDMACCAVLYGAGYVDYRIAEMYRLGRAQRKTVITRGVSNRIVATMNDKAYWPCFDDKAAFNAKFRAQVNRPWVDLRVADEAAFRAFLAETDAVIGKPIGGSSGRGIVKYARGAVPSAQALRAAGIDLLEACVVQHPRLAALCPTSVNTLRVATLLGDKQQGIVYAALRIGNGKVVDNVDQGGMAAPVDLTSGRVCQVAADKKGGRFAAHPLTGVPIVGFELPFWPETRALCLAAMREIPQVRFVAWDVALTETGPVFIEGNSFPSHAIPQFAAHYPDGVGILPRFRAFIDL